MRRFGANERILIYGGKSYFHACIYQSRVLIMAKKFVCKLKTKSFQFYQMSKFQKHISFSVFKLFCNCKFFYLQTSKNIVYLRFVNWVKHEIEVPLYPYYKSAAATLTLLHSALANHYYAQMSAEKKSKHYVVLVFKVYREKHISLLKVPFKNLSYLRRS